VRAAGQAPPATNEGRNLLPIIHGQQPRVRDTLFAAYRGFQRMIRDERWKLIKYDVKGDRHAQLFDLAHDPYERHNLADDPTHAAERQRLEADLLKAREHYGDPSDFDGKQFAQGATKPVQK
jgi:arylsulfatase A-like enzyme